MVNDRRDSIRRIPPAMNRVPNTVSRSAPMGRSRPCSGAGLKRRLVRARARRRKEESGPQARLSGEAGKFLWQGMHSGFAGLAHAEHPIGPLRAFAPLREPSDAHGRQRHASLERRQDPGVAAFARTDAAFVLSMRGLQSRLFHAKTRRREEEAGLAQSGLTPSSLRAAERRSNPADSRERDCPLLPRDWIASLRSQ